MRTFTEETWHTLVDAMESLGEELEKTYGVSFKLDVSKSHPAVINNERLYADVKPCLSDLNYVELRRLSLIHISLGIPNREHASGIKSRDPPATPEAPQALIADSTQRRTAEPKSTSTPRVFAARCV